jgi:outer membrane protein TolC
MKKLLILNRIKVVAVAALLCSAGSFGQTDELLTRLTKGEAISTMLENNFGIKIANNAVRVADNNKNILNSNYLPTLSGTAGATYDNTSSETSFNGALDNEGNPRPDITIDDAETRRYNASLNLDYTLFDGLGRYYNYKSLKEQYNLSQLEARETIELTTLQLISVYYEVARQMENVSVLEDALTISKQRELRAGYQFDYGQVSKLEVLNARVDVNTDSINLLVARQQLVNTKRDLNLVLNRELETQFTVDTTTTFISLMKMNEFREGASQNNVSLLQNEKNIELSDYDVKRAKAVLLPSVGLSGSYGWNRSENPAGVFFPGTTGISNTLNVGLNLRWNIFDGGSSITNVKNARIALENQNILKAQLTEQVYRDLANAMGNYETALYIYRLQEQNVLTNDDNFRRSQEQFKIGQITSVEFRQAQLNLLNALTVKNAAKYSAKIAEANLLQLTGQLLNTDF